MIDSLPSLSNLKKLVKVVIKENFRNDLSNILIKLVQIEEEEFKFEKCKRRHNFYPLHKQKSDFWNP